MIKCVLTFVSGVQESVLVDFISQNKVKILHIVKICQNCLYQIKSNKFILCEHERCQQVKQTKKNNINKAYFSIIIKKFRLLTTSINRPT